jgi:hypothetical protein
MQDTPSLPPHDARQTLIWIASYPKSGNTWVRVFVHNLLKELAGKSDGPQDINRLHEHTGWEFGARPFEAVLGKPFAEASHRELAEARPLSQGHLARTRLGPRWSKRTSASDTNSKLRPSILTQRWLRSISFAALSTWRSRFPITSTKPSMPP